MAVKIRCRKTGANNDPCFRVVATDVRSPRDGKCLETLGWYDPKMKVKNFWLNLERLSYWQSKGAQASEMVTSLLKQAKKGKMAERQVPPPPAATAEPTTAPAAETAPTA